MDKQERIINDDHGTEVSRAIDISCALIHSTHPRARGPTLYAFHRIPRARGPTLYAYPGALDMCLNLVRIPRLRVPGGLIGFTFDNIFLG